MVKADREEQWKKADGQEDRRLTVSFCVNYTQYNFFKDFGRKGKFLPEFLLKNPCAICQQKKLNRVTSIESDFCFDLSGQAISCREPHKGEVEIPGKTSESSENY